MHCSCCLLISRHSTTPTRSPGLCPYPLPIPSLASLSLPRIANLSTNRMKKWPCSGLFLLLFVFSLSCMRFIHSEIKANEQQHLLMHYQSFVIKHSTCSTLLLVTSQNQATQETFFLSFFPSVCLSVCLSGRANYRQTQSHRRRWEDCTTCRAQ